MAQHPEHEYLNAYIPISLMPTTPRTKPRQSTPEAIEKRLHTLLDHATERARKRMDVATEKSRELEIHSWYAHQLEAVEKDIKELARDQEDLTPYGRERLRDARAYRKEMRDSIARMQAPHDRISGAIMTELERTRAAVR